jgi:hypothetical protein
MQEREQRNYIKQYVLNMVGPYWSMAKKFSSRTIVGNVCVFWFSMSHSFQKDAWTPWWATGNPGMTSWALQEWGGESKRCPKRTACASVLCDAKWKRVILECKSCDNRHSWVQRTHGLKKGIKVMAFQSWHYSRIHKL